MFNGYVYKAYCTISEKCYIGITTRSLPDRMRSHFSAAINEKHARYGIHFYKAIRKYGTGSFIWTVLTKVEKDSMEDLIDELKRLEIEYINNYDSFCNGYNKTPGGDLTFKGTPKIIDMYNEDGEILDSGTAGMLASKYNLDISAVCKVCNRKQTFTGMINNKKLIFRYIEDNFTKEDRNNLASKSKRNGFHIKGYFLDSGVEVFEFNSAKEAADITGFCSRSICNCASGKYKYAGKMDGRKITWKYVE